MPSLVASARAVEGGLRKFADALIPQGDARWSIRLSNGVDVHAAVSLDRDWISIESAVGDASAIESPTAAWALLESQTEIAGGVRWALESGRLLARAETPRRGCDLAASLGDACAGLRAAAHLAGGTVPLARDPGPSIEEASLAEFCAASGWRSFVRSSGEVSIELEADSFVQADVTLQRGQLRVGAPLVAGDGALPPVGQAALGLFLLRAAAALRLVRPFAVATSSGWSAGLEVILPGRPGPAALDEAAAALSVGHRLCAREAILLSRGGSAAVSYLAACSRSVTTHADGCSRPLA